jgi:hypothetical protein
MAMAWSPPGWRLKNTRSTQNKLAKTIEPLPVKIQKAPAAAIGKRKMLSAT